MYFDDVTDGCGDYKAGVELDSEPMRLAHTVVVAATSRAYDTSASLNSLENGLAHLCVSEPNLDVYIFNSTERLLNLDWGKALNAILKDLEERGLQGK